MKRFFIGLFLLLLLLVTASTASAYVAASSNFKLEKDSLNFGGTDPSASANFSNNDTLGEIISGITTGTNFNASSGYRYMNLDSTGTTTVLGCTDPSASNYNYLANQNDGSCTYTPPPPWGIGGCTDPKATNYNPNATFNDGSCQYGIPNVSDFLAKYDEGQKAIHLTWKNPLNYDFKAIIIVRGKWTIPTSPTDGLLIYSGKGESHWDEDVEAGVRYYYTAFVKSQDNKYSSGVVATERVPGGNIIRGCTDPSAPNYNPQATVDDGSCPGGGGTPGCTDPLAVNYNPRATADDHSCNYSPFFSTTTPAETITHPSNEWDFRFIQPKERVKTFDSNMRVRVVGAKDLTILFNYNLAPATLKTIGVTLTDPNDKTKTFSFLMHRNVDGSAYEATVAPLIRQGTYPVDIYIINYDNQAIKHIKGRLIVGGIGILFADTVAPIAATTGLALGFLPSLYDLLIILFRIFGYFFGRRKNENPWGTVYDSVTKRPLDPVYLTVSQILSGQPEKEISTAITDIDGRFSFFLPAGTYTIKANKTHYRFPSERLAGKSADELYEHLYFGSEFTTNGEAVINLNVPMDPIDFDWNEFAKTKTNFFEFYNQRRLWFGRLYKLVFASGFVFSLYALFVSPSWWNIVILALYLGLIALNRFWHNRQKPLQIIKKSTGEPLPFAIVRVFLPDLNQQIKYTVADKLGRFYLLVRPGVYYYTVEEKQLDGSYLKVSQSQPISLPKGVLTTNISV
ncbi:MAG: hypothetical protein WC385_00365 [Candidatus Paceibacterota bacterium]|jgi:hypothetical protein